MAASTDDVVRWLSERVQPEVPKAPGPADGELNVAVTQALVWTSLGAVDGFDVYGGTSSGNLTKVATVKAPTYTPSPPLLPATKYYWKVVAKNHTPGSTSIRSTSGPVWSFTTQAAAPTPTPSPTPITDRLPHPKPAPLPLGPAGFTFRDPVFGSTLIRATDERTAGGASLRVPSNTHVAGMSVDGTILTAMVETGGVVFLKVDPTSGAVSVLPDTIAGLAGEPSFSFVDANVIYAFGTDTHNTILRYDFRTKVTTPVLNLVATYPSIPLADRYIGGLVTADSDAWAVFFGGAAQDEHTYIHHSRAGRRQTPFRIHSISLDRTSRYVIVYVASPDVPSAGRTWLWDTVADTFVQMAGVNDEYSHDSVGYGVSITNGNSGQQRWDGLQWTRRTLSTRLVMTDLIVPPLEPQETYIEDHNNWRHVTATNAEPFVSATRRRHVQGVPDAPWRAWDDEILIVPSDGSGVVTRIAHHQSISDWVNADGTVGGDFWAQPIIQVDPLFRFVAFTSNWGRTLPNNRQDVFLAKLGRP